MFKQIFLTFWAGTFLWKKGVFSGNPQPRIRFTGRVRLCYYASCVTQIAYYEEPL